MELLWRLRSVFDRYLANAISLEDLENQVVPLAPALAELPSSNPAADLWDRVDLMLAEMSKNHRSEDELRMLLRVLLATSPTINVMTGPRLHAVPVATSFYRPLVVSVMPTTSSAGPATDAYIKPVEVHA